jgi:hypothetical protein
VYLMCTYDYLADFREIEAVMLTVCNGKARWKGNCVHAAEEINEEVLSVVGTQKPEEGNLVQCIIVQMRKE